MSTDAMNDVFPIVFDFKDGEEPTSVKLTGLVKHVDTAFADITRAVGDPWDYQSHSWGAGSGQTLSLENLSQASLARLIGPSDWIGPLGGELNSATSGTITVLLKSGKNSWNLGYPLVKVSTTVEESSEVSNLSPLTWGTDIVVTTDTGSILGTRKTSATAVTSDGDFYVDFYTGVISSYNVSTSDILLTLINFNQMGAGVPWGTHNVIPTWNETVELCNVTLVSTIGDTSTYTLTLPTVISSPRVSTVGRSFNRGSYTNSSGSIDTVWNKMIPGSGSQYLLPPSLTGSGMLDGETIPEGFVLLWDEVNGRVKPQVTFKYKTSSSLTLETPAAWLTEGQNYRIITVGCSLSEAISYLLGAQRYDSHVGLQSTSKMGFSPMISHDDLINLFDGALTTSATDLFKFRKSSYVTNPHPQYLHRAGYLHSDLEGNSANSMRGDLVFTGLESDGFALGTGSNSGTMNATYGIYWGGVNTSLSATSTSLVFEGGENDSSWSSGSASRYGFGLTEVGACPMGSRSSETYGALTYYPFGGTPLYLKGQGAGPSGSTSYLGAYLALDLGRRSEMNYMKLMMAYRNPLSYDQPNQAAHVEQAWGEKNPITPALDNSYDAGQVREFRFRGVSLVSGATNTTESLGGSTTRSDASAISEFEHYFTSPGVVGADFINVYGNAIFFSETGDGKATDFTTGAKLWLDNPQLSTTNPWYYFYLDGRLNGTIPTGMYYHPFDSSISYSHCFIFSIKDYSLLTGYDHTQPLRFGDRAGFEYASNLGGNIRLSTKPRVDGSGGGIVLASGATSKNTVDNIVGTTGYTTIFKDDIRFYADRDIYALASRDMHIQTGGDLLITATDDVEVRGDQITLLGTSSATVQASSVYVTSTSASVNITGQSNVNIDATTGIFGQCSSQNSSIEFWNTASSHPVSDAGDIGLYANDSVYIYTYKEDSDSKISLHTNYEAGGGSTGNLDLYKHKLDVRLLYESTPTTYASLSLNSNGASYINVDSTFTLEAGDDIEIDPGSGNNIILTNLPTSDPGVAGALYNSSGTIKIST
jgi:hypothetical protein